MDWAQLVGWKRREGQELESTLPCFGPCVFVFVPDWLSPLANKSALRREWRVPGHPERYELTVELGDPGRVPI